MMISFQMFRGSSEMTKDAGNPQVLQIIILICKDKKTILNKQTKLHELKVLIISEGHH